MGKVKIDLAERVEALRKAIRDLEAENQTLLADNIALEDEVEYLQQELEAHE